MALLIQTAALLSRRIRTNLSNGVTGSGILSPTSGSAIVRKISNLTKIGSQQEQGGLLSKIWNGAGAFLGWVGGLVKGVAFSVTAIWGWLIGRFEQLKSFDWNASDAALKQAMDAQNVQLASLWGGVAGQGFGWLAGIVVGGGIAYLCPVIGGAALARSIMAKTSQEAFEEIIPTLTNAIGQTAGALANRALISGYIQYRNLLKKAPRGLLVRIFGADGADFIQNIWGAKDGPNMSFNTQMDEFVEGISNPVIQAFVEEFFDESWDAFTEAGFIVAHELDEAFAQHKMQSNIENGTPRSIILEPDREGEEELTFSHVPQQLLYPVVQTTLNTHRLINNRDLGAYVGQPATDWARARPQLRQLTILFRDRPRPPWRHLNNKRCREATYSIPDAKVGLTWEEIKAAADPFNWGKYRATAQLDNQRQMAVYGATPEEAKAKLRELMRLSTAEILTLSVTEEEDRPTGLKKEATRMYPCYATLLMRKNSVDNHGRVTIDNRILDEDITRFALWVEKEPSNMPLLR